MRADCMSRGQTIVALMNDQIAKASSRRRALKAASAAVPQREYCFFRFVDNDGQAAASGSEGNGEGGGEGEGENNGDGGGENNGEGGGEKTAWRRAKRRDV